MNSSHTIWTESDSGILSPVGRVSDARVKSRADFIEVRKKAKEIEQIYSDAAVPLPGTCDLGRMVRNAKELWGNWFLNDKERLSWEAIFQAMHLNRIADAVLPLRDNANIAHYLKALRSGSLNFSARELSKAKDTFWEMEVWARLLRRNADAHLAEPDVVVNYDSSCLGIACKKIYSERHVQNVLSQAVRQIEKDFDFGIVALNLDDLLPGDTVLKRNSTNGVADILLRANSIFLQEHERHFRKYLSKGRLISAMVSTSVLADVPTERPRLRNTYQWTVWTMPGLGARYQEPLDKFYGTVMGRPRQQSFLTPPL